MLVRDRNIAHPRRDYTVFSATKAQVLDAKQFFFPLALSKKKHLFIGRTREIGTLAQLCA
jgi:hypothetical protein